MRYDTSSGISSGFPELSPSYRQVAHVLLTHPPLIPQTSLPKEICLLPALDLHVLGTPPAFVLSQDQTLHRKLAIDKIVNGIVALVQIRNCLQFLFAIENYRKALSFKIHSDEIKKACRIVDYSTYLISFLSLTFRLFLFSFQRP